MMNHCKRTLSLVILMAFCVMRAAHAGLPLTQSTTYVPNSTPAIKAQDLNDLQKYLSGVYSGVFTVKSLYVDGTGGMSTASIPGRLTANSLYVSGPITGTGSLLIFGSISSTSSVTGTTLPNTTYDAAVLGKGSIARGWAVVNDDGSFERGYNTFSVTRTAVGVYNISFWGTVSDPTNASTWVTIFSNGPPAVANVTPQLIGLKMGVQVKIYTLAGAFTDRKFTVGFYGE